MKRVLRKRPRNEGLAAVSDLKSNGVDNIHEQNFSAKNEQSISKMNENRKKRELQKLRQQEIEEDVTIVTKQCTELASVLQGSKHVIVYTGAGISTSANIPDFRGSDGIWTRLNSGKNIVLDQSLTSAEPTVTHMCLKALYDKGIVKHIVSQNCDGLHFRSGIPQHGMSEIHGNMYLEICSECNEQFYRIFDVTEKTSLHRHKTERKCENCRKQLRDTIVHFGERSNLRWPHNWEGAVENAENADVIICLGSSLKVLRSYKQLWMMSRRKIKRPNLYIVNLQWTPKDSQAVMKIHSRVDFVMETVTKQLGIAIPAYTRENDPLYSLATPCDHNGPKLLVPQNYHSKFGISNAAFQANMHEKLPRAQRSIVSGTKTVPNAEILDNPHPKSIPSHTLSMEKGWTKRDAQNITDFKNKVSPSTVEKISTNSNASCENYTKFLSPTHLPQNSEERTKKYAKFDFETQGNISFCDKSGILHRTNGPTFHKDTCVAPPQGSHTSTEEESCLSCHRGEIIHKIPVFELGETNASFTSQCTCVEKSQNMQKVEVVDFELSTFSACFEESGFSKNCTVHSKSSQCTPMKCTKRNEMHQTPVSEPGECNGSSTSQCTSVRKSQSVQKSEVANFESATFSPNLEESGFSKNCTIHSQRTSTNCTLQTNSSQTTSSSSKPRILPKTEKLKIKHTTVNVTPISRSPQDIFSTDISTPDKIICQHTKPKASRLDLHTEKSELVFVQDSNLKTCKNIPKEKHRLPVKLQGSEMETSQNAQSMEIRELKMLEASELNTAKDTSNRDGELFLLQDSKKKTSQNAQRMEIGEPDLLRDPEFKTDKDTKDSNGELFLLQDSKKETSMSGIGTVSETSIKTDIDPQLVKIPAWFGKGVRSKIASSHRKRKRRKAH